MSFDWDPENFDFDEAGVTEDEYYSVLDDLMEYESVLDITHSLPMNEVRLFLDPQYEVIDTFPDGFRIRGAAYTTHEDYGDCIEVMVSTTRFLAKDIDNIPYFTGEYSDECMAFLKAQLDLFPEIESTTLAPRENSDELCVFAKATDTLTTTYVFDEVITYLGVSIDSIGVVDGNIEQLVFIHDGTSEFTRDLADTFRLSKLRTWQNAAVDSSGPISAPCGHDAETKLMMLESIEAVSEFPTVDIDGLQFYQVPVEDTEDIFLKPVESDDTENESETSEDSDAGLGGIARGYLCSICNTAYVAQDEDALREHYSTPLPVNDVTISVPESEDSYTFLVFDIPYRPTDQI